MGTEVHFKNSFPGYYSMRNINEDSNNSSWHLFNALTNGHYYDSFTPRAITDAFLGHDKDEVKEKILQHEAIFKNQVYELHRLYRRQRDMMEEVKRKEFHISIDTSSSSSLMPSQKPYDDANRLQIPSFPLVNTRTSIFGAEISNSPVSCSKRNGSNDCEVVECRPSKVRKKLFDLQLPAHEYIEPEEGEHIVDNQTSEISSYPAYENGFVPKIEVKTFLDDGGTKDTYNNTASGQHFLRCNRLADLNEPVCGQDVDFLGRSAKPAALNHLPLESKSHGRNGISSFLHEPGNSISNLNYTSHRFEMSKLQRPFDTMQHGHGKEVQHRGIYSEISSQNHSHNNQTPLLISASSAHPFITSSDTGNSWSHMGPSWEKSNDSLTRKLTSFQTLHTSYQSSPRSHEVSREKWHRNGNGSSSGIKDTSARLPSIGFDYRNCNKIDDGSHKIFKGSNFVDLAGTTKDMDLNTVQNLSNEDDNSGTCDHMVLPWLRSKPLICKNGGDQLGDVRKEKDDSLCTNRKLLGFPIFGTFCVLKNDDSSVVSTPPSIDINVAWDEDDIDKRIDVKTDEEIKNLKNHFDLNSCVTEDDDVLVTESVKSLKKMTMEIDLEAPAVSEIEEEDAEKETELKPDYPESKELEKIAAKAIIAISSQQDHVGPMSKTADDNSSDDPLLWFAEVINSFEKKLVSAFRETDEYEMLTLQLEETKEEDYMPTPLDPDFQEPEEVGPTLTSSRPRRGQARRGRPRRDFQRDILPGMTSLSRHEITEDLQIFGGLMRATGHSWSIGSTRRNGKRLGAQGRRKVKAIETTHTATTPPLSPSPLPPSSSKQVEVVGLDERSLTGWGRTTRRPRRQRCAAGNSVAIQIT